MATNWKIGHKIPDPNTHQGRWEILDIKKGGMGVVYIGYDHEWRQPFAIKTFQDKIFDRDPAIADRFFNEAYAWVRLDAHPNVVEAQMVAKIEGKPFLFLEYVSSGDLGGWIGTPRLTEDLPQVLRFVIHFCDGMIHILSKGIKAHRDIKPSNCLVTEDKTLKVTDLGLAKIFDDADLEPAGESPPKMPRSDMGLSRTGKGVGTLPYMAPEQFDDAKRVDERADIYSFGVMLFEMTTQDNTGVDSKQ
jgi:serine/threonine protein kinase